MIKYYNDLSNTYVHFESVVNILDELDAIKECNFFYIDEANLVNDKINAFHALYNFENSKSKNYKNSNKHNRQAVKLTFLLPRLNLRKRKLLKLRNTILKYIISKGYTLHLTYIERKGKARYLNILISERAFYKRSKWVCTLANSNVYKDSVKHCYCKQDNPNAVLYARKGDVLKKEKQHFSNVKMRCFCKNKTDWRKYLLQLHKLYIFCIERIGVQVEKRQVFNKVNIKDAKNKYQVWKIQKINNTIVNMNLKIDKVFDVLYCDACYYQNYEVLRQFQEIFHRYRQRLNNKRFHHGRVVLQLGLNTYYKTFNENIKTFEDDFIDDVDAFVKNVVENY